MPTPKQHPDNAARQRAYRERRKRACLSSIKPREPPKPAPIPTMPSAARWKALRRIAEEALSTPVDEMEQYRDERSETWQESPKAEAFQEILDKVEDALQAVQDIG